jgi:hypothetical protein
LIIKEKKLHSAVYKGLSCLATILLKLSIGLSPKLAVAKTSFFGE